MAMHLTDLLNSRIQSPNAEFIIFFEQAKGDIIADAQQYSSTRYLKFNGRNGNTPSCLYGIDSDDIIIVDVEKYISTDSLNKLLSHFRQGKNILLNMRTLESFITYRGSLGAIPLVEFLLKHIPSCQILIVNIFEMRVLSHPAIHSPSIIKPIQNTSPQHTYLN
jgi:hypothetical protein